MLKQIKNLKLYYEGNEYEGEIPCSLFSFLSKNGCLPDPYKDDNEKLYISAAEKDCSFVANFEFHPIGKKNYVLRIGAIDTIAKIYLNGKFIGENTSAFYPFQTVLSYSDFLDGDNVLRIDIQSPITYLNDKNKKHYVDSQMDTEKVGLFGRAAMRKPQYSFGWDWGAALPDLGVYEPITIEEKKTRLNDFTIKQIHKDGKVKLVLSSEITCRCRLYSPENEYIGETTSGNGVSEILVNKPQLWWCNNLGPQPLYTLTIEYQDEYLGETIKETKRIGLRTIEISQELDEWGREFAFVLNGQKIFAFGANYIPEDQIIPWYDVARTKDLLQKCKQANFNMIRVWGGGIYPSDTFYDTCDELGIIVWLDFMFACQSVYLTEEFRNNVQKEIEYQVKRISTHASIGLLCGNNEGEYMIADRSHKSYECLMHRPSLDAMDYLELYEHIIPDICEKYAPDTFYWSCSPSSGGGFYLAQNENFGDSHVWNCWEENKPLDSYKNNYPRFLSEFGFISYPSLDMIRTFTDNKIESITDESVKSHFKKLIYTPNMQEILSKWNEELFGKTDAIEEIVNNSQILQGKMLKGFIEHMRIHRGRCMGALIWQLNDSMPSVSWSLIDYAGGEKLSLQAVKEAFAPTIAIVEENNGYLDVYVSNETPSAYIGTLQIEKLNYEKSVSVEPFSTKQIDRLPWRGNTQTLEEVICKLSR